MTTPSADLPKGFGEMKPSAKVEAFGRAFDALALSSLGSDVGLVDIGEARLRLMECRKTGINPRKQFRRVMEFAERQALLQSSAWAARAEAKRLAVQPELIPANAREQQP